MSEGWRQGRVYGLRFRCRWFIVMGLRFWFRGEASPVIDSAFGIELAEVPRQRIQAVQVIDRQEIVNVGQGCLHSSGQGLVAG